MTRYITRPRQYWDAELEEEIVSPVTMTIHEDDNEPQYTGLLDPRGEPLYRVKERPPHGL